MRAARYGLAIVVSATVAAGVVFAAPAHAEGASDAGASRANESDAGPSAQAPKAAARGVVVLATPGAESAAWALAKEVYAKDSLRPSSLDEPRARVLAGEPPASDAPRALKDLADERAAVHGDDGASRTLLREIATQLGVRAIVVVAPGEPVSARVFLAEAGAFDAARYAPEPVEAPAPSAASDAGMSTATAAKPAPAPPPRWAGTVSSLERTLGDAGAPSASPASPAGGTEASRSAPALATSATPDAKTKPGESHPFYTSPWFWGAVGAAAFGGAAVWFATRDNTPSAIHLQLQVH